MNRNILGGIIILFCIAILFGGVFLFKDGPPGGLILRLQLDEAKGLKTGDVAYMKGVSVGEIRDLGFEQGRVVAELRIGPREGMHVPADSFFFIWPDQILTGKQCIIIEPGDSAEPLKTGSLIEGESSKTKILLKLGPKKIEGLIGMIQDAWQS